MVLTEAWTTVKLIQAGKAALDHLKGQMKSPEDIAQLNQLYEVFQAIREENRHLRAELRQRDDRAAARANYERRTMGQATFRVLVKPDGTDGPPCCPKCNDEDGEPIPLQGHRPTSRLGTYVCPACTGAFPIPVTPHSP